MSAECMVAYDHNDEDGFCAVCGWSVEAEAATTSPTAAIETGPDRVRAAIERDRGNAAPAHPITLCGPDCGDAS